MTTFGLRETSSSFGSDSANDASKFVPNIDVVPADDNSSRFPSSNESGFYEKVDPNVLIEQAILQAEEFPLVATQPLTQPLSQSQARPYRPDHDQQLVGCLIPATGKCEHFDLYKNKKSWRIGRYPSNDLILPGGKLSNFHCTIQWNGKSGKQSEVILVDSSSNGTWVNNMLVTKGNTAILRGGAAISLGAQPDVPNDWRFIFRDIEGQSDAYMEQIWAKYDVGHELGSGAFARVHRCIERTTGDEYAVKIIERNKLRSSGEASVAREIKILKQLAEFRHKNIVTLREHFEEEDSYYLIMELVPGGDLLSYIGSNGAIEEQQVRRMAAQICHAIAYVHSQGIAHRDLKPENVMLTSQMQPDCKVADFGLAKLVDGGTFLRTMCGTPAYLAPEVVLRGSSQVAYDNKVDSWSLGVIFYCMLTNHSPFQEPYDAGASLTERQRYFGERQVNWGVLDGVGLSDEGHDFLRHLLAEDPRTRKSVAAMLDHSWICALVPSESQCQHPTREPLTPTTHSDTCTSMENLDLSDIPIPGLSLMRAESDVTKRIPGAFPVSQPPLRGIAEAVDSLEVIATPAKRKNNLIAGSSPLSSLSDLEVEASQESEEPEPEPPRRRPRANTAKMARKMVVGVGRSGRRPTTPPAPAPAEDAGTRRSTRRHAPKAARYA